MFTIFTGTRWSRLSMENRAKFLLKLADLIEQNMSEFAEAESMDQGKPVWLAEKVDIPRAVKNFRPACKMYPSKSTYEVHSEK